jgi:hypothetical protein
MFVCQSTITSNGNKKKKRESLTLLSNNKCTMSLNIQKHHVNEHTKVPWLKKIHTHTHTRQSPMSEWHYASSLALLMSLLRIQKNHYCYTYTFACKCTSRVPQTIIKKMCAIYTYTFACKCTSRVPKKIIKKKCVKLSQTFIWSL